MSLISRAHSLYAVEIGAAATIIGGIEEQNVKSGEEIRLEAKSGEVFGRFPSLVSRKPGATFKTLDLKAALDAIAMTGLDINGASGMALYAQKKKVSGTRATGSVHRKYAIADGVLTLGTLSATGQEDASLTVEVFPVGDGTNDPIIESDSAALPSAPADLLRYGLGPATIGGKSLPQASKFELSFGLKVVSEGGESDLNHTFVSISEILPVITLSGIDVEWLKSTVIPRGGIVATHANTSFYLRKRLAGGSGFVPDITAEHIKITAAGLAVVENMFDASGQETGECSIKLPLSYDGTNDPAVINTVMAIT